MELGGQRERSAAVLSIISWATTPASAGHNPFSQGHGHGTGYFGGSASHHHGNGGGRHHPEASGNPHSNKGGELRGLDRADQVAGSHGEEGRENAEAHHTGGSSSGSDSDSE
jgi:hypothetical protein